MILPNCISFFHIPCGKILDPPLLGSTIYPNAGCMITLKSFYVDRYIFIDIYVSFMWNEIIIYDKSSTITNY